MKFVRKNINNKRYIDNVFLVSTKAKDDPNAINASIGSLIDEDGKLFTYNSVFNNEKNISNANNAAYANPIGNVNYLKVIKDFILDNRVTNNSQILATAGGTGAIHVGIKSCLDEGDTIILPEIGWGNYRVIADEMNLNVLNYDVYNIDTLFSRIDEVKGKAFIVINSPCHNPCGQSYSYEEWKAIIDKVNSTDKEIIILNDVAYIDYASKDCKEYFNLFNTIKDNVLVLIAYSCSKSFSYYGKRVGALIAINNDSEFLDTYINYCTRIARTTWSNVNNGAMQNIADVIENHYSEYEKERENAVSMLKKRTDLFVSQAKECGLDLYKYSDGFFVTVKAEDQNKRDILFDKLIDNHIYAVKVTKGIRVGMCALPLKTIDGLALTIKSLLD